LSTISKRAAKRDKIAIKKQKVDKVKPRLAPSFAFRNAGLISRDNANFYC